MHMAEKEKTRRCQVVLMRARPALMETPYAIESSLVGNPLRSHLKLLTVCEVRHIMLLQMCSCDLIV